MDAKSLVEHMTEEEHKTFAIEILNQLTEDAFYEVINSVAEENSYDI